MNDMVACYWCGVVVLVVGGLVLLWWYLKYKDELTGKVNKAERGKKK